MDRVEHVKKPLTVRLSVLSEGQQEIVLESTLADDQGPDWGHMAVLVAHGLVETLRHMTVPTFQGEGKVPHTWKKESENAAACTRCGVWLSGYTEMTSCPAQPVEGRRPRKHSWDGEHAGLRCTRCGTRRNAATEMALCAVVRD